MGFDFVRQKQACPVCWLRNPGRVGVAFVDGVAALSAGGPVVAFFFCISVSLAAFCSKTNACMLDTFWLDIWSGKDNFSLPCVASTKDDVIKAKSIGRLFKRWCAETACASPIHGGDQRRDI